MVHEYAELQIVAGQEQAFEAAVREAVPLFRRAAGCRGMELQRVVETAGTYLLVVRWETLEHHTVQFRGSPDFLAWRALVGKYFASAPSVRHGAAALHGF
jgi:heme-degrading monooxygenase HmoA